MPTLAQRAKLAHRRGIVAAAKETITFQRGAKTCEIESAIRTEAVYDIIGPDGLMTQVSSTDWFLPQDEVLIDSEAVEPKINDRIKPDDGKTYEPMKPGPNMPAVIPHCGTQFWCVHSKVTRE